MQKEQTSSPLSEEIDALGNVLTNLEKQVDVLVEKTRPIIVHRGEDTNEAAIHSISNQQRSDFAQAIYDLKRRVVTTTGILENLTASIDL